VRTTLILAALALAAGGTTRPAPARLQREKRPCLHCGTPHDHNNSFCSASCCREYKRRDGQ
jgi:hypothetical protein